MKNQWCIKINQIQINQMDKYQLWMEWDMPTLLDSIFSEIYFFNKTLVFDKLQKEK